ncbi:TPA: hypothetical protein ENG04_05945 [Candidatus Poribacteria bacterium]|nr:hypothetical protein [Candidatus Poribacteria bacterium]HEX29606.1 hypothetical protein [Candidatus Poribacteria bacterium]
MKFLLDQNISPKTTQFLRSLGYDVLDTRELQLEKASDRTLWEIACEQHRIFVTFDKGFSDIRDYSTGYGAGVIIFRTRSATSKTINRLLSQLLANYSPEQIKGNLIIITENRIRIRPHIRLI